MKISAVQHSAFEHPYLWPWLTQIKGSTEPKLRHTIRSQAHSSTWPQKHPKPLQKEKDLAALHRGHWNWSDLPHLCLCPAKKKGFRGASLHCIRKNGPVRQWNRTSLCVSSRQSGLAPFCLCSSLAYRGVPFIRGWIVSLQTIRQGYQTHPLSGLPEEPNRTLPAVSLIPSQGGKMRIVLLSLCTLQIYHAQYKLLNF